MARDKLITIRVEADVREAFNNWCEARNIDCSRFLYDVVKACLAERIDERILDTQKQHEYPDQRIDALEERIANLEKRIDKRVDVSVSLPSTDDLMGTEGLSDRQLAKIVGLNPSTLNRYRIGKRSQGKDYERVMKDWEVRGNRWFKRT